MRRLARVGVCALLSGALALADAAVAHAQVDPGATYRTLETSHFRVTYEADLEDLARHAAARAEVAYAVLARTLTEPPDLPIDIVVANDRDLSNGAATPLPSNRIWIWAKSPVETRSLAFNDDWIDIVITHELAHSFHLDAHGPLGSLFRKVFGRVPFTWPVFPALGTPLWSLEGLAVQVESALTGFGRIHGDEGMLEFVRVKATALERFVLPGFGMAFADPQKSLAQTKQLIKALYAGSAVDGVSRVLRKLVGR